MGPWLFENRVLSSDVVCRSLGRKSGELEYISKYRQLEAQELDLHGGEHPARGPGNRPSLLRSREWELFTR